MQNKTSSTSELNYDEKVQIIDKLKERNVRIDFSGGELLVNADHIRLIEYASKEIGKENIGISISGAFLDKVTIDQLSEYVHNVEMTLDYIPYVFYPLRPSGYHEYAARGLIEFHKRGIVCGAQTVLTKENIEPHKLKTLAAWLIENEISEWSLLRFFPSGRGSKYSSLTPSHAEYCKAVAYIKEITENKKLVVNFQYLLPNQGKYTLDCRAVKKSFGILPDGTAISCFWALGKDTTCIDNQYVLDNLKEQSLDDILNGKIADYWRINCNQCVFFSQIELETAYVVIS